VGGNSRIGPYQFSKELNMVHCRAYGIDPNQAGEGDITPVDFPDFKALWRFPHHG